MLIRRIGLLKALVMFTEHKEDIIQLVFKSESSGHSGLSSKKTLPAYEGRITEGVGESEKRIGSNYCLSIEKVDSLFSMKICNKRSV